jgi:SAM-dependent methyltransferase
MTEHSERIPIRDPFAAEVEDPVAVDRYRFSCAYVAGKSVLDVACGNGYGSFMLRRLGAARSVIGVDRSPEAISLGESFIVPGEVDLLVGDATALPLDADSVDVVISFETIEHLSDPSGFLSEVTRVLRSDGIGIFSTPLNETPQRTRPANPFHVREYSEVEFMTLLSTAFFRVESWFQRSKYRTDLPLQVLGSLPAGASIRSALRRLIPPAGRTTLRRITCARGLHCVATEIGSLRTEEASVQIAVCREPRPYS